MKKSLICLLLTSSFALTGCNRYKSNASKPKIETTAEDFEACINEAIRKRPQYNTVSIKIPATWYKYDNFFDYIFNHMFKTCTFEYKIPEDLPKDKDEFDSLQDKEGCLPGYDDVQSLFIKDALESSFWFSNVTIMDYISSFSFHSPEETFKYYKSPGFKVVHSYKLRNMPRITKEYIWNAEGYIEFSGHATSSFTWFNS